MIANKSKQQGYFLIIAVVFIMVLGLMGVVINYMFSSRATLTTAQYNNLRSFYLAESGLDIATHYLSRPSISAAPARISCASVTGTAQLTNASLLNGTFTATTINSSPIYANNTLSGAITSSATSLTLTSAASFATSGRVVIDGESIDYAGKSSNTLTNLVRGVDGTLASSHASGAGVGQYQCSLDSTAGIPSVASPTSATDLQWNVQLQDGWIAENLQSSSFEWLHWNQPTELAFTNVALAGGTSAANMTAISMLSNAYGWAVTNVAASKLNFLNWNGSAWSLTTLTACSGQHLLGISMVSSQEGWAVGDRYRAACAGSGNFRYTVVKWNGTSWSLVVPPTIPADTSAQANLLAVSVLDTNGDGLGDIGFAVGDAGAIIKYNGSTWVTISSSTTKNLTGVSTVSASEAWAVGATGTILKYNGTSWSTVTSPTAKNLTAISMYDSDGDGLANFGVGVGASGVTVIYNGSTWSLNDTGATNFFGVAVANANEAWAVGASGTTLHWNGTAWETISSGVTRQLNAISLVTPNAKPASVWRQIFH